jgi:8-oxo-dGTP diphosphatase
MEFKISCLLFIRNHAEKILLLKRKKSPNQGLWSPPGGKLKMNIGESPYECAVREAKEETGMNLVNDDLSLFGYMSEKGYENSCHWLMFLFECKKTIVNLPQEFEEGYFDFFSRDEINHLGIPASDHELVWPFYDKRKSGFWGISADCSNPSFPKIKIEASPE